MKVLVTGDRNWSDIKLVVDTLEQLPPTTTLIHGACEGADTICATVAEALGFTVRAYPADWETFKLRAGPIRNQQMLVEENTEDEPIDMVIAFHDDIERSKGTKDMLKKSKKAGIKEENIRLISHPRSSEEQERFPAEEKVVGSIPTVDAIKR